MRREGKGSGVKIIIDRASEGAEAHAREAVAKINAAGFDPYNPRPVGVAHHSALYPNTCDECGETFWARDQWATHRKCKTTSGNLGFGA